MLSAGVGLGWILATAFYVSQRFGRIGTASMMLSGLAIIVWFGNHYRQDISKREFVNAIRQHRNVKVFTTGLESGSFWTGDINYLYFEAGIREAEVLQILRSPGLKRLERIVFKRARVTDKTLKQLGELPSLGDVYLEGTDVTMSGIENLIAQCPGCRLQVRD